MDGVAAAEPQVRKDLFAETASQMCVDARIVEKDFWVCWALKQLFSLPSHGTHFTFKGGTTLSKVFGVIQRFSEDVDIAVDWVPLGFVGDRDPAAPRSKTKQARLLGEMLEACRQFITGDLKLHLERRFAAVLNQRWSLDVDPGSPDSLRFKYPRALSPERSYVLAPVVLEFVTHAELVPSGDHDVVPYAAEKFPSTFREPAVRVHAISAERTFWEKATILHAEHHRPAEKRMPLRYSRHYYDTVLLARSEYGVRAQGDLALLERVVDHKRRFYPAAWARYDLATPSSLKLVPQATRVANLRRDYAAMEVMFFGPRPEFEVLLAELEHIEHAINNVGT